VLTVEDGAEIRELHPAWGPTIEVRMVPGSVLTPESTTVDLTNPVAGHPRA
jgi:hypothetical protein